MHVSADHIVEVLVVIVPLCVAVLSGALWVLRKIVPTRDEFHALSQALVKMGAAQEGTNVIMSNHIDHLTKSVEKLTEVVEAFQQELHLRTKVKKR